MENINLRMLLLKIGISSNIKGFHYIIDAVNFIKNQQIHTNMTTVYEKLAKKHNTNYCSIERAIRHSIQKAYKNNDILKNIYGTIPDNSAFVFDLVFNFDILYKLINNKKLENQKKIK